MCYRIRRSPAAWSPKRRNWSARESAAIDCYAKCCLRLSSVNSNRENRSIYILYIILFTGAASLCLSAVVEDQFMCTFDAAAHAVPFVLLVHFCFSFSVACPSLWWACVSSFSQRTLPAGPFVGNFLPNVLYAAVSTVYCLLYSVHSYASVKGANRAELTEQKLSIYMFYAIPVLYRLSVSLSKIEGRIVYAPMVYIQRRERENER
jgi:hypothetical protein